MRRFLNSGTAIAVIMLIMITVTSNLNWNSKYYNSIIRSDAKGYYAYLPAVFIYRDLNFGFFNYIEKEKHFNNFHSWADYRSRIEGKTINKYPAGVAVAMLPFYAGAHLYAGFRGIDQDGYTWPYHVSLTIAALFYLLTGLIFIRKILKVYGTGELSISVILAAIVFGTNIFYYTVSEPGMSHIYSLAFFSMFIYFAKRFFLESSFRNLMILSLLLGIIVLIRPVNLLILLSLPFLAGSMDFLRNGFRYFFSSFKIPVVCSLIFLLAILPQLIIYKISTGHFLVDSYNRESFYFLRPHFFDFLFSYKKGFFLYTPLMLLFLVSGSFYLYRQNKYSFYTITGFLVIIVYVLSSWRDWWYGGSFSSRPVMEYIPFFTILAAVSLNEMRGKMRKSYITLVVFLTIFCQIQIYQYRYNYIHWADMTKEKYWDVFMRVDLLIKKSK